MEHEAHLHLRLLRAVSDALAVRRRNRLGRDQGQDPLARARHTLRHLISCTLQSFIKIYKARAAEFKIFVSQTLRRSPALAHRAHRRLPQRSLARLGRARGRVHRRPRPQEPAQASPRRSSRRGFGSPDATRERKKTLSLAFRFFFFFSCATVMHRKYALFSFFFNERERRARARARARALR